MRIRNLHRWDLPPKEAVALQRQLAGKINTTNRLPKKIKVLAGCDISTNKFSKTGYAGVVLLDASTLETLAEFTLKDTLPFPYVPGLLSFREGPLLLKLFEQVTPKPDLIFFDGQGLAHPRRLGLACHMGLWLECPTIGCAKTRLTGQYREPAQSKGAWSPLKDETGEILGGVLRTRENCKPVFISPGHRIDLETAIEWTRRADGRYRIPEPTRRAHLLVNAFRKQNT